METPLPNLYNIYVYNAVKLGQPVFGQALKHMGKLKPWSQIQRKIKQQEWRHNEIQVLAILVNLYCWEL